MKIVIVIQIVQANTANWEIQMSIGLPLFDQILQILCGSLTSDAEKWITRIRQTVGLIFVVSEMRIRDNSSF